jgi:ATP/maltotriose-dependent transcriptional regulator MalT
VEALTRQRNDLLDLRGLAAGLQGQLDVARELAGELGLDSVLGRFVALWDGRWEDAETAWATALRADEAAGDLLDATLSASWLAAAQDLLGRHRDAVSTLRQALVWSVQGPQVPAELAVRAELARLLAATGATAEAATHMARCDEILAGGEDWRGRVGTVELAHAEVAATQGQTQRADAVFATALEVFEAYRLPWQQASVLRAWTRWLRAWGRVEEAAVRLESGHEIYRQLGASERWQHHLDGVEPTREQARAATAEADPTTVGADARLSADQPPLSRRELEVLRLVAAGLSDREICRRLVLSPHTVHRHMANIRHKLAAPSRAAAVAHATRINLI